MSDIPYVPLEEVVKRKKSGLTPSEEALFVSFLKMMFKLDPDTRPQPKEILKHEWLRIKD